MKWLRRGIVMLVGLALLGVVVVYGGSELMLRRVVPMPLPAIKAATNPADIIEGARLARFESCTDCHGKQAQGQVMFDDPLIARITAPSLARVAANATDAQLARAIRHGVGIDARPLFVMPTKGLNHLSDDDLARLIAWMRTLPMSPFDKLGALEPGPLGRLGILTGQLVSAVTPAGGQPARRPADIGRYLAHSVCMECHDLDRERKEQGTNIVAPPLVAMTASYEPAALRTLLRTGKAAGNRELLLMSDVARKGLFALSDAEIGAIHAYLRAVATGTRRP